jgi:hypothetical protein
MVLGGFFAIDYLAQAIGQGSEWLGWWMIAALAMILPVPLLSASLIGDGIWWFAPEITSFPQPAPEEP